MIYIIKHFLDYFSDKKLDFTVSSAQTGKLKFKQVKSLARLTNPDLLDKLKKGQDKIDLTDKEILWFKEIIPESFSDYIHYRGKFYFINFSMKLASKVEYSEIDERSIRIFDLNRTFELDTLKSSVRAAVDLLEDAMDRYEENMAYDSQNYSIEKERMTPNETYDSTLSITKEQSKAMYKWQENHNKKYHKKGFGYQGVSPTSNFEIKIGSNSIGTYADCICISCMEKAANADEVNDAKAAEKIRKQASFEVFNNM